MMASLQGNVRMGTKEDESSTWHVWAAGFHHVMAGSRLAHVLKITNCLLFNFHNFFSGHGKMRITETTDNESVDGGSTCIDLLTSALNGSKWSNPHFSLFILHPLKIKHSGTH
jgi:hypothetical protein